jgi:hypothetical protein
LETPDGPGFDGDLSPEEVQAWRRRPAWML